jgi:membrane-associated protein
MCGVARIDVMKFAIANAISATIWGAGFIYLGYVVGERIEGSVDKYLLPISLTVIVLSFIPVLVEYLRERRKKNL